jgi:uncharacterized membrane protein YkvA (DUF1232 family)
MKMPTGAAVRDFFKRSFFFLKAISTDSRIPARDKAVLAALLALVVSPIDFIPDFIPVFGQLDDFVIIIVILDYVFNRIPEEILVSHFPWNPSSLKTWRRRMRFVALMVPGWARKHIWKIRQGSNEVPVQEPPAPAAA